MAGGNANLGDDAARQSRVALLLIDTINDLEFPGGDSLLPMAKEAAANIALLKGRAHQLEIPVIYVNDNFGRWRSEFSKLLSHCLGNVRGRPIARQLKPRLHDYRVLKPKHSGFYSTTLEVLLEHLGVKSLILTGFTTDNCVLFTANDAYMRDYRIIVPSDCVASMDAHTSRRALEHMRNVLKADTTAGAQLDLASLAGGKMVKSLRRGMKHAAD